jgi:GTP:adenosylcobinamide-phosphate guanylyltransferase
MENIETNRPRAYAAPLDAIVLAGTDDNPRRMIRGQNKAFLEIGGQTLVRRVAEALLEAASVSQVFVVGPSERLRRVLGDLGERITIVEQAGKMLTNAWQAIYAAEARFRESHGRDDPLRPLLFISADLPLVSAAAIDDFVDRCASVDSRESIPGSMLAGVAEEASLSRYYADARGPGIRRPYVHLAECRVRLANIYVGRPRTLAHQEFLQTGFDHRKAEQWKNVIALAWNFLGQSGGWQAAWITLRLQATLLAARGAGRLYHGLRRGNTTQRVLHACSTVLGGTVRMVITPWGGLSLDADNDDDFQVLSQRFEDWRRIGPVESSAGSSPGKTQLSAC